MNLCVSAVKSEKPLILLALMGVMIAGCASDPRTAARTHNINTVAIDRHVSAPGIRFGYKLDETGNTVNATANIIANSLYIDQVGRLKTEMQNNNINLPQLVHEKFTAAAQNLGFELTNSNPDALFVLRLEQYGFDSSLRTMLHGHIVPFAVVVAELQSRDGEVYWRGRTRPLDVCIGAGATWKQYEKNPEQLRDDWTKVIENSVRSVLRAAKPSRN
jgi:hypothetical protein